MGVYALAAAVVIQGVSTVMKGDAKKKAAYSEASQVELEARVRAKNIRKQAQYVRGAARAGYAASGVVVDEGSALLADASITRESELDALYTLLTGKMRAKSLRAGGKAAATAGWLGAASSALSAYGSFAGGGFGGAAGSSSSGAYTGGGGYSGAQ
jgi:uncharacterized membrane protein YgcG